MTGAAAATAAAAVGVQDHQEGIAAKVELDLGASLERLSRAASRNTESSKVCRRGYRYVSRVQYIYIIQRRLAIETTELQTHD